MFTKYLKSSFRSGCRKMSHHGGHNDAVSNHSHGSSQLVKDHAIGLLTQCQQIIDLVNELDYTKQMPKYYNASVGSHVRHIVNHYEKVCGKEDVLKYDIRERNSAIELDKLVASALIKKLSHHIKDMHLNYSHHVTVEFMANEKGETYSIQTNLMRELAFVAHHGIHHMAIIKMMVEQMGYHVNNKAVGFAPSTLNHNLEQK